MDEAYQERTAFSSGWDAHEEGRELDDNPHEFPSSKYDWWADGWRRYTTRKIDAGQYGKYPRVE